MAKSSIPQSKMDSIIYFVGLLIAIVFIGYMWYTSSTLGKVDSDYSTVCIGGHEYNRGSFASKGFLAIKLTDDGKPIKCIVGNE